MLDRRETAVKGDKSQVTSLQFSRDYLLEVQRTLTVLNLRTQKGTTKKGKTRPLPEDSRSEREIRPRLGMPND